MRKIIFDLLLLLGDVWIIFDKDSSKLLKCVALLAAILLTISIAIQILTIMFT